VVEVRRKSDRVMATVMTFGAKVIRVISAYRPQAGRSLDEKNLFYDNLGSEYELQGTNEMVFGLGDFNGHVGKQIEGCEGVHGGNGIGKRNAEGRMLLEFCDERELCVANTWFKKTDKRKITFKSGMYESEIDFVLVSNKDRKYLRDVKAILWELQHRLVVVDVDEKKLSKICKKESKVRMTWKLQDKEVQENFEKRVGELVDVKKTNLWESFRDGVLKACNEICGKKKVRKNRGINGGGMKEW